MSEAVNLSADEALKAEVIDVVTSDLVDLLKQIHGSKVKLAASEITLTLRALQSNVSNPGLAPPITFRHW